jgi:hypothetical protein
MGFCTDISLLKDFGGYKTVATLRCKRWSCPECGPRRCRDLQWRAKNASPTIFLTLTIRRGFAATPDLQAKALVDGWRMLRQYLMRWYGWDKLPFLAVVEKHKSGWPHLHVLLRSKYIDHRLIRDWWTARFNSPRIWIEAVTDQQKAAVYVSKYLAKSPWSYEGCKRYWASHDFDLSKQEAFASPDVGTYIAHILRGSPIKIITLALIDGAEVTFDGKRWIINKWTEIERRRWYD